ncbi:ATPase family AAA domain-containing protein 5 isoform X2 [Tiliqua scincoides]|uniref:ATPase family AAA domain-containing protein 5 isoform X2 n=1 Tax=Tiliqua scincoides TaxID=71010 RepID=UPI00346193D4
MAVAAVAAAAPPPDGEVQPCKKRKEEDFSAEAITKYFSPLAKHVDRVLSPPKSNNIMDYFKKTSPANEKITSPLTEKESQTSRSWLENSSKPLSRLKKKGKRYNLNNKLKVMGTIEHDLMIEINSDDSGERFIPKEEDSKAFHSVPALLAPLKVEEILNDCGKNPINNVSCKNEEENMEIEGNVIKRSLRRAKKRKHKDETNLTERFSPEAQLKEQCKEDDKQVLSTTEPENKSVINKCILEPETITHKTPQLNDCVVTVSFEDFLKSQSENKDEQIPKSQTPDDSIASDETVSFQATQQLPLKTVTVLAQIHSVPPKSPSSRKIASIFLKQKPKEAKRQSSLSSSELEYSEQMTQKRKSNVVIAEEELELAVLEIAGSDIVKSKCTAEERYQFMKAFRQPESDTLKIGTNKGLGKQKEVGEKSSKYKEEMDMCKDDSNKKLDNEVLKDCVGSDSCANDSKRGTTRVRRKKLIRKKTILEAKRKSAKSNESSNSDASNQIKRATSCGTQSTLAQKNGLRRSVRQRTSQTSINTTPEKTKDSETATTNTPDVIPLQTSTPKTNRKSFNKSDLYKAEVITEPFDSKSPIRMKFTRISTYEGYTKQNVKVNSTFSNISKAKKLVEKAKTLQHNRATRIIEDTQCTPLRRSSRQQALAERKILQNNEDMVIILDSSPSNINTVPESVEKRNNLKSLNDVLGKKAGNMKTTKKSTGKERMSSLIMKKVQKLADEAVTIFVDSSSEDESENSQDVEQFKAKREFLMSGLPESLKRQIAKRAATLEAYSTANSCFQTVIHVQQKDDGCSFWRLAPPTCSFLRNIREVNSEVTDFSRLTLSLGEFSDLNAKPNSTNSAIIMPSGWRPVFSETLRSCLLEEIRSYNSQFPVKQFFDQLLKKQVAPENNKPGLQLSKCKVVSLGADTISDNRKETKRKRKTEDQKSKRKKQMKKTEIELSDHISKEPCVNQTRMENMHLIDTDKTEKPEMIIEDSKFGSAITAGFENEEILWTEKYQPQNSSELVGNTEAVKKLHRWLSEWKRRADWEENRNQKEEKESLDSVDFKDDQSDDEEESLLCNTMLLIGPPGVGKTAAVYACALELGFKIFEVNASCQRSGRQILSQLKEATQSHQVDKQGVNAHKPCFYTSCSSTKSPKNKECLSEEKIQTKLIKQGSVKEESSKKSATSLILFEEVDVIFDEDVGFLNAIKTFMTTTKRPVILTTNDPSFSLIFDGCFEEITFCAPSLINVASYLQVLCLAENLRTDVRDFAALLTANNSDIRQSLLHLQFWVRSGGGFLKEKGLMLHKECKEVGGAEQITCIEETSDPKSSKPCPQLLNVPKCDTGCFEHLLGLKNIFLPSEDLFSFLKREITTEEEWSKLVHLLTEFQMKNIDFINSNLQFILPLPVAILPEPMQMDNPTLNVIVENSSNDKSLDYLEKASPVKKVKTKRQRNMALLDDSDLFESELNYSGFVTVPSDTVNLEEGKKGELQPVTDSTMALSTGKKPKGSALAFQCLNSLSEFVENMSFLDFCFHSKTQESKQSGKLEEFLWTKGNVKNGVSDESSVEYNTWWSSQSSSELKATVEALSFNKCFKNISRTMNSYLKSHRGLGKDELEELTLHVSKDQANIHFSQSTANASIHRNAQKRLEIIKAVFSSRTLLNLGNTQASIVEYMPTLRNICRSEKLKEKGKTKRRFLHYLEGIHLDFSRELLNSLAADFP